MVFFWENNAIIIREYHALVIVFILYLEIVSTPFSGQQLAEKIRLTVEKLKIQIPGGALYKTLSIGVAGYPSDGEDIWDVIKAADMALYAAKRNGRNRVEVYTRELLEHQVEKS